MVTGGYSYTDGGVNLDTTETLSSDEDTWTNAGARLPRPMGGLRAATIDDRILIFGNYTLFIKHQISQEHNNCRWLWIWWLWLWLSLLWWHSGVQPRRGLHGHGGPYDPDQGLSRHQCGPGPGLLRVVQMMCLVTRARKKIGDAFTFNIGIHF